MAGLRLGRADLELSGKRQLLITSDEPDALAAEISAAIEARH